jgi:hypothetical protein
MRDCPRHANASNNDYIPMYPDALMGHDRHIASIPLILLMLIRAIDVERAGDAAD